jgi:hypothetical protein
VNLSPDSVNSFWVELEKIAFSNKAVAVSALAGALLAGGASAVSSRPGRRQNQMMRDMGMISKKTHNKRRAARAAQDIILAATGATLAGGMAGPGRAALSRAFENTVQDVVNPAIDQALEAAKLRGGDVAGGIAAKTIEEATPALAKAVDEATEAAVARAAVNMAEMLEAAKPGIDKAIEDAASKATEAVATQLPGVPRYTVDWGAFFRPGDPMLKRKP